MLAVMLLNQPATPSHAPFRPPRKPSMTLAPASASKLPRSPIAPRIMSPMEPNQSATDWNASMAPSHRPWMTATPWSKNCPTAMPMATMSEASRRRSCCKMAGP